MLAMRLSVNSSGVSGRRHPEVAISPSCGVEAAFTLIDLPGACIYCCMIGPWMVQLEGNEIAHPSDPPLNFRILGSARLQLADAGAFLPSPSGVHSLPQCRRGRAAGR